MSLLFYHISYMYNYPIFARNLVQSIESIETYWTNVKCTCIQWTRSVEGAMKREAVRSIYPPTFPTCEQCEPIVCSSILRILRSDAPSLFHVRKNIFIESDVLVTI